jgi:hypothetical protein
MSAFVRGEKKTLFVCLSVICFRMLFRPLISAAGTKAGHTECFAKHGVTIPTGAAGLKTGHAKRYDKTCLHTLNNCRGPYWLKTHLNPTTVQHYSRLQHMGHIQRLLPILIGLGCIGPNLQVTTKPSRNFVEFFAGDRSVTLGLRLIGYVGTPVDVRLNEGHDFMTPLGFLLAVAMIWSVAPGGLVWFAPPCSTWVWMSRHSTGRDKEVKGKTSNPNIQRQNCLVSRLCYLIVLCWHRSVTFVIEQPASTIMFKYPRLKKLLDRFGDCINWAYVEMGCWSREMAKNTVLVGSGPHINRMGRRMTAQERKWMRGGHQKESATHWTSTHGKKRSRGGKDLKPSQSYPMGFGCMHALEYKASFPPSNPSDSEPPPLIDLDTDSDSSLDGMDDPCLADLKYNDAEWFCGSGQMSQEKNVPLKS